ncbi:MAG: hypothetical protein U0527_02290 [Candidatus Eisenbacteria bacterium]
MLGSVLRALKQHRRTRLLPPQARVEIRRDRAGLPIEDPGAMAAVEAGLRWLARAQDRSASADGGIARHWSIVSGWDTSYPETTGYIVPTLLACADRFERPGLADRARRALNWLVSLQYESGAFPGGKVGTTERVPVTFNTGQILLGLAAGAWRWDEYIEPMQRCADWLVETQDEDGCWRRFPSPFNLGGDKTYETHVSWGLLEAAKVEDSRGYLEAAERQVRWAMRQVRDNGWVDHCCLNRRDQPLTHTLAYAIRGILEFHRATRDPEALRVGQRAADGALCLLGEDGFLSGRIRDDWSPAVDWACLTGTAQFAACWFLLHDLTRDTAYLDAAWRANRFVRRTLRIDPEIEADGGVKGSFPVDGSYGPFQYLSWACKFMVDSNLMELAAVEPHAKG